jgi:hypothetical protein
MKLFTVEEANALVPMLRPKLEKLRINFSDIRAFRENSKAAATSAVGGGGVMGATSYVNTLMEFGALTSEITDLGVQIKDPQKGLIDFPSMRGGRIVLLCWMLGEIERIEWWHEMESGFAGRQPL